ncbi:MAG: efflux RND transporter periplasmic adaptor subunit, partial [Pseudomonadota bacterium]
LKKAAEPRTKAEDALGDAELATYTAQRKLDDAYIAWRQDGGPAANVETARKALEDARKAEAEKRAALETEKAKEGTPLPTRLEGGLEAARDDLAVLEVNMQRTRVRAPRDGTILDVSARVGETITPSPQAPAVELGNLETLIIRSELEERDLTAVEKGQKVIVRSNAFPGRDFEGQVRLVAPSLSAPKLSGRGPRAASDVDVVEVEIALEGQPPLIPGMRVDVFFKPTTTAEASGSSGQPAKPTN